MSEYFDNDKRAFLFTFYIDHSEWLLEDVAAYISSIYKCRIDSDFISLMFRMHLRELLGRGDPILNRPSVLDALESIGTQISMSGMQIQLAGLRLSGIVKDAIEKIKLTTEDTLEHWTMFSPSLKKRFVLSTHSTLTGY